jgi:protein-disulfide isomerase
LYTRAIYTRPTRHVKKLLPQDAKYHAQMADFRDRRWVPRVLIAAAVALIGYAIVAISVGEGGPVAVEIDGSDAVQRQYGGLPQDEEALGNEDAPVTVRVFTDIQCSDCARWFFGIVPALVEGYVRDGDLRIELRHYSLGTKTTQLAAVGAEAAAGQGREFQFAHLFMLNLGKVPDKGVSDEFLLRVASAVPRMEGGVWEDTFEDPATEAAAREDTQIGTELRLPTGSAVIVEGPAASQELTEDPSLAAIEQAIAAAAG